MLTRKIDAIISKYTDVDACYEVCKREILKMQSAGKVAHKDYNKYIDHIKDKLWI